MEEPHLSSQPVIPGKVSNRAQRGQLFQTTLC
jgi:hypothetical protein